MFDREKFLTGFKPYFREVAGKSLTPAQASNLDTLLGCLENSDYFSDVRKAAYAIATAHVETYIPRSNSRYAPVTEAGSRSYFNRYEKPSKKAKELGNIHTGDGYLFRGRGFVQITGRNNYTKFGFATDPDAALIPHNAFAILERGMEEGVFTGKSLDDYINDGGCDYVNARRVINGTDRAREIAGYARNIEHFLRDSAVASVPETVIPAATTDDNSQSPDAQAGSDDTQAQPTPFVAETKEIDAPASDNATTKVAGITFLGIALPTCVTTAIHTIQTWIAGGYISTQQIGDAAISFIQNNTKYVFAGLGLVIGVIVLKVVCKQLSFFLMMIINACPFLHDIVIKKQ